MAGLIWEEPTSCSRQAAVISSTSSAVRLMSGTSLASMLPASCATLTVSAESVPISAAARGLYRGVQRQQIGLTGDLLHDGDLLGDRLHRLDRTAHRRAARFRILGRLASDLLGLVGVLGVLLHVGRHFLHR